MTVPPEQVVTVLDGSTFVVCDGRGDLDGVEAAAGFFAADTRFLSRLVLTIDGERGEAVSLRQAAPHLASFTLRAPHGLAVTREVFVGRALEHTIVVENTSVEEVETELALDLAADFADIHAVKRVADGGGGAAAAARPEHWNGDASVEFADEGFPALTRVFLDPPPEGTEGGVARYALRLAPGATARVRLAVQGALEGGVPLDRGALDACLREDRRERDDSLAKWWASVPRLAAPGDAALERTWRQSLADLAALRLRWAGSGLVPAAGLPWFMTLFGRDTLIAAFQTLPLGPEPAVATLRALAETQADADDPERDAEPGKIVHEIRRGKTAVVWADRYYGTVDATPLFLVLLSELWRWTGDDAVVRELEGSARRALAWIDAADRDGDGFVEYLRRSARGLDNQNWKDSHDSMVFRDGSEARAPIAAVEAQGYVYDAKLRVAELARAVWHDDATAARLEAEAATLRSAFDAAFWLPERGWYALGLDAEKRPVDALGSNMGHLLLSGIVPDERVAEVVARLTSPPLWSGWGVRTLAADEAAFDAVAYHDGTVWPHDNSLIAYGLARAGHAEAAGLIARALLDSAPFFEHRLPELFAGTDRTPHAPPGVVPTSARPQAWAAGTPVLLLRALLGLEPDGEARALRATAAGLPAWAEGLALTGVHAFGSRFDIRVEAGAARVDVSR